MHSVRLGVADVLNSVSAWRIWFMLAWNDVAKRYRRSGLGQFWLTLSMGFTILGLGTVYGQLFNLDTVHYLPYISVTFVLWGLISACVIDSCQAFIENEGLIRHIPLPRASMMLRVITRNLVVMAHNAIIIPCVFLYYGKPLTWEILWLVPGLLLVLLNLFWMGCVLAVLSARYRDIPQIVSSAMQIIFFITPVMFTPAQLATRHLAIFVYNPFANLLELVRNPLLGEAPSGTALAFCCGLLLVGLPFTLAFVGRYGRRVVYWL